MVVILTCLMGFKSSKNKEASRQIYETSRDNRSTRKGGKRNLDHLYAKLLVAGKRISELRQDLNNTTAQSKEAEVLVSNLHVELARVADSLLRLNRILRQNLCRLHETIRAS